MSGKKWKLRQDGRRHYALLEDADVPANVHTPPIAFLSFVEQQHRDLIAAAPEMLEALEAIIATNPHNAPMTHEQIRSAYAESLRSARAAIAKAKGETP
jgi:hypothetical protein